MLPNTAFIFKDDAELQASLQYWQNELKLQHWYVDAGIARAEYLDLKGVNGTSSWGLSRAEAIIKLLDPIDYSADCIVPQDHEVTLVHELLHLHMAPFTSELDKDSLEYLFMERAIDVMAKSMVDLRRRAGDA